MGFENYNNRESGQSDKEFFAHHLDTMTQTFLPENISSKTMVWEFLYEWFDIQYENFVLNFNHYWPNVLELTYASDEIFTVINFSYDTSDETSIIHNIDISVQWDEDFETLHYNAWLDIDISCFDDDLRKALEKIKTMDWYNSLGEKELKKIRNFVDNFLKKIEFSKIHDKWYMENIYPKLSDEKKNSFISMLNYTSISIY